MSTVSAQKDGLDLDVQYREESALVPLAIAVVASLLILLPAIWMISLINREGKQGAVVTKYETLVQGVRGDVDVVDTILVEGGLESVLAGRSGKVRLIVPDVVLVDEVSEDPNAVKPLKIKLEGIYWSPTRPIVGIQGETYNVGDMIQGYEIVEIGKDDVHFKDKNGEVVVKGMYENLRF